MPLLACPEEGFRCAPGAECFPQTWVCDGHPDCEDERDELNCSVDLSGAVGIPQATEMSELVHPESLLGWGNGRMLSFIQSTCALFPPLSHCHDGFFQVWPYSLRHHISRSGTDITFDSWLHFSFLLCWRQKRPYSLMRYLTILVVQTA